jgi:Xaa-Pro aminopeptidase
MRMIIREKVRQAAGILKEMNIDCWITFVRESALNGDPILDFLLPADVTWHSALVITAAGDAHAIVGQYDRQMIQDTGAYREVTGYVQGYKEHLQSLLKRLNPRTIAANYSVDSEVCDGLTHGMYLTLHALLADIGFAGRLTSAEQVISALRQRKSETELKHIREAIRITLEIYDQVAGFIAPGKTEKEIAAFIRGKVDARGIEYAWEPKVCPAVFTGPDTAEAHYGPTDRRVEEGHILNMDFGVKHEGYCSDLQRTLYIRRKGEHVAPPEVQKGFDTIVKSIESSRAMMKPGIRGIDVDTVARTIIVNAGYEEYPHALGHQVGRFAHDGTALLAPSWEKYANKPYQVLEEGMVFTLEPRLKVKDRGIATVEEMVVVTRSGAEYLSAPQTELILV